MSQRNPSIPLESLNAAAAKIHAALLVMHAPLDAIVGIENASDIFVAAKHPKSFVTLDDADHLLSNPADAEYAANTIATWARRYITLNEPEAPAAIPEGILRVTEADADGFLQDVQAGPHHLLADEPATVGGTNRGLTPYGLLSAGLGACTSMTIRMYARRKKWLLTGVSVDISHAKQYDPAAPNNKIDAFHRSISLRGDLDSAQKQRLLEIADKCPVHKTLEAGAKVETSLA